MVTNSRDKKSAALLWEVPRCRAEEKRAICECNGMAACILKREVRGLLTYLSAPLGEGSLRAAEKPRIQKAAGELTRYSASSRQLCRDAALVPAGFAIEQLYKTPQAGLLTTG